MTPAKHKVTKDSIKNNFIRRSSDIRCPVRFCIRCIVANNFKLYHIKSDKQFNYLDEDRIRKRNPIGVCFREHRCVGIFVCNKAYCDSKLQY